MKNKMIFESTQKGQHAYSIPRSAAAFEAFIPNSRLTRQEPIGLPEVSEIDLTRHFAAQAKRNCGIDNLFYPLGSCTMKLNPRVNEWAAALSSFQRTHPLAPDHLVQGNLELISTCCNLLCQITGMTCATLLPNAGAQGEFVGIQMIAAYHHSRKDRARTEMLIPEDAHGTNPATAQMCGFTVVTVKTDPKSGEIDLTHLKSLLSEKTAGLMLTNPNTLGLFSRQIREVSQAVHQAGGLLYYDGANLNAILEVVRPGEMGFDVMHINLHKTFSTPHGGGGPGSGPVCCNERLKPFLPVPRIEKHGANYQTIWKNGGSIGLVASFHGNFSVYLRATLYMLLHGRSGLRRIAEVAVLNANYLKKRLSTLLTVPFERACMHEFIAQVDRFQEQKIRALDFAKRLLDYGVYAPTIYFPLIIKECLLIEPTESESLATLDRFVEIVEKVVAEIKQDPELVRNAPHTRTVRRLDEVRANRYPILRHKLN